MKCKLLRMCFRKPGYKFLLDRLHKWFQSMGCSCQVHKEYRRSCQRCCKIQQSRRGTLMRRNFQLTDYTFQLCKPCKLLDQVCYCTFQLGMGCMHLMSCFQLTDCTSRQGNWHKRSFRSKSYKFLHCKGCTPSPPLEDCTFQ